MKNLVKGIGLFGLVITFGLIFLQAPVFATDTIKIGMIYSMTGAGSVMGNIQKPSTQLAIDEINKAGGVKLGDKKYKIEVIHRDDETKPDVAIRRVTEMIRDHGVKVIIGGTFSHVSVAINELSKKEKFWFMASNGVADKFFTKKVKGPYSMSIIGDNGQAGRGAAAFVADVKKAKNIVFFMPDYAYGKFAWKGAQEVLSKREGVKYNVVWSPVGTADMTPYLLKCMEYKPDFLCLGHWGNDAINALKQAYDMGLRKKTQLFFNWIIDVMAAGIPAEGLDGVWMQMYWYHDMSGFTRDPKLVKAAAKFDEYYTKALGMRPDPYGMGAYTGAKETFRAMEMAGSDDPKKMYQALLAKPGFYCPKGPGTWRVDGRPRFKYNAWIAEGLGPKERKDKDDYARIIDVYAGDAFLPPTKKLGW